MLRKLENFVTLVVCVLTTVAVTSAQSSYPASQITSNNTAACSADNYGLQLGGNAPPYCYHAFPDDNWPATGGWADTSNSTIITYYHDPTPAGDSGNNGSGLWNIAKGRVPFTANPPFSGDMHLLMYGGTYTAAPTTNMVVEVQGWFCNGVSADGDCPTQPDTFTLQPWNINLPTQTIDTYYSHADVQYTSWDPYVADAQVLDIWDRGGDTIAADWDGAPQDCPPAVNSDNPQYPIGDFDNPCGKKYQDADDGYQEMADAVREVLPTYRPSADMKFFMIMDDSAWKFICGPSSGSGYNYLGQNEPWCAANKMISDLEYLASTYTGSPNYATYQNFPVIAFFQNEGSNGSGGDMDYCQNNTCLYDDNQDTCIGEAQCYADVYQQVYKEANKLFPVKGFYFLFAHASGCPVMSNGQNSGHPYSDGCYAWVQPYAAGHATDITYDTQEYGQSGGPQSGLDYFYGQSVNPICAANGGILSGCVGANGQKQLLLMGAAFKGFDDLMTNPANPGWYAARVATQGCGDTWMKSWREMNSWYSQASNPLPYMMIPTWNDYEEGTEIETGIDNCIQTSTFVPTINDSQLTWNYDFHESNDPFNLANVQTVDHYDLYYTMDGCTSDCSTYYLLDHQITGTEAGCSESYPLVQCSRGVPLNSYGLAQGTYGIFIGAVGKPGITNWLAPTGATYTVQ